MEKFDLLYDTFVPSEVWLEMPEAVRRRCVNTVLTSDELFAGFECMDVFDNGHVVLRIERVIAANVRGLLLLDLEARLKSKVDVGVTVWLEPVGDKSKLRQLRGVEIKS